MQHAESPDSAHQQDSLSLNIGCGRESVCDVRLDFVRTESTNIVADAQRLPFREGVFSFVYERNVLEHLPSPGLHLREVRRVLSRSGRLHLITDNAACLKYYLLGTHTGGYCRERARDKHYALFTCEHVKNLLTYAGFNVLKIEPIETDYFTRFFDRLVALVIPQLARPRILALADRQ